jgi:hypothetical protein
MMITHCHRRCHAESELNVDTAPSATLTIGSVVSTVSFVPAVMRRLRVARRLNATTLDAMRAVHQRQ